MKTLTPLLLSAALATAAPASAQTPAAPAPAAATAGSPLSTLLRDALFEEEATRDLTKAAAGYEALLSAWAAQRPTAAAALYRLAEVRRKQDRKDDAIALYQRLLREFPDIEPHAKLARENLTGLGAKEPAQAGEQPLFSALGEMKSVVAADSLISAEEAIALQRLKKLAVQSPDLLVGKEFSDACSNGWLTVVQFLLSKGVSHEGNGFYLAAANGHLAIVQELLKLKPGAGYLANAVESACANNRLAVLKLLLESGASPEVSDAEFPALWIALDKGHTDAAELLLSYKANPDPATAVTSPLFAAARTQNVTMIKRLLALKADPNRATRRMARPENTSPPRDMLLDPYGATPLHAAVASGNAECVKLLLEAKANPNAQNEAGWTPLHGAVQNGSLPLVEQLLAAGADANLANKENETPLLKAVILQQRDIAAALLRGKADPNALVGKNKDATAFAYVFNNKDEAERDAWITLFLERGADPFAGQASAAGVAPAPLRIRFLRSHKYPALAATPAITLVFGNELRISPLAERKEDNEKPAILPALLTAWNEKGGWNYPSPYAPSYAPDWSTLRLWRKGADGKMQETVLPVKKETQWPALQWGDVIEVLASTDKAPASSGAAPGAVPRRIPVPTPGSVNPPSSIPAETLELLKPAK